MSGVYHYIRSEPGFWTVGTGTPRSAGGTDWEPESDHRSAADAAKRVIELNGGGACDCAAQVAELREQVEQLWTALRETRADVGP